VIRRPAEVGNRCET